MTNEPDARAMFNPFVLWTDMGMRAAEMTVASLQNMTEGADRLTRAGAGAEVEEPPDSEASVGGIAGLQRLMWDLATRNWLRWTSAFGSLLSAGAGVGLARTVAGQENPLRAARVSLRPAAWGGQPAAHSRAKAPEVPARRSTHRARTDDAQHALAAHEPKPRRKAAAKPRRSQRSARK